MPGHIHFDRACSADAFELALLQNAQKLCLKRRGDLAYFVEKQRAAVGQFEAALAQIRRAGKSAALMAEKFGFKHIAGKRRAVHFDERLGVTRREVV